MVACALGAIVCALIPVSPYPPLTAELRFAFGVPFAVAAGNSS